jgi:hypothetical protein
VGQLAGEANIGGSKNVFMGSGAVAVSGKPVTDHFASTREGQSGILVNVHSTEFLRGLGWSHLPVFQTQSE